MRSQSRMDVEWRYRPEHDLKRLPVPEYCPRPFRNSRPSRFQRLRLLLRLSVLDRTCPGTTSSQAETSSLLAPNASVARKCRSSPRTTSSQTQTSSLLAPNASVARKCRSSPRTTSSQTETSSLLGQRRSSPGSCGRRNQCLKWWTGQTEMARMSTTFPN